MIKDANSYLGQPGAPAIVNLIRKGLFYLITRLATNRSGDGQSGAKRDQSERSEHFVSREEKRRLKEKAESEAPFILDKRTSKRKRER